MACGKLKSRICKLPGDVVPRLASVIRYPTEKTVLGRQVINSIIPALTLLRNSFDIYLSTMFSYSMLRDCGLQADVNAADLKVSDIFFDSLPLK
jgi:hypothetical protein